jgi:hypothetical protein
MNQNNLKTEGICAYDNEGHPFNPFSNHQVIHS